MACISTLKGWVGPNGSIVFNKAKSNTKVKMEVPCGQCWSCRLARSREWAARLVKEAKSWPENQSVFLTLTYDNDHLPAEQSLKLEDFQNFMKALRYAKCKTENGYRKIKFFHCGEYGKECKNCQKSYLNHKESKSSKPKTGCNQWVEGIGRPHYHAIIFGISFDDMELLKKTKAGEIIYKSAELDKLWGKGFCSIGRVTFESCAYVARYIMKKVNGDKQHAHYKKLVLDKETGELKEVQLKPEYITMSRRPGIGREFAENNLKDMIKHDAMLMKRREKQILISLPRYYNKIIQELEPEKYEEIKDKRRLKKRGMDLSEERALVNQKITRQKMKQITRDYEIYHED